ncbi:hypothetical protein GLAREA_09957 [Glarea lozoyensis ATCC 20868]|uniref:Concanavalin A-like lectins/glucanase n=1 Tax=Glarea lozoyensis (strain ATCC 20868 / MF5171) TaxID=1116229 RepID=S3DA50_GLAL2|nr:uncharacterized protein GLAREA_09957 [Glarea lozoyensis ATCC 20868]EPE28836.1 hypothetical protein GLAREA_09957 [Glarea lozoyensis ATCC 20868]
MFYSPIPTILMLLGAVRLTNAQANAAFEASGAQYILYSGNISASVSYSSQFSSSSCASLTTPSYSNAHLYIGKNPPWDPNPFFFELYHSASDGRIFTNDQIFNLDFSSSAYECFKDGKPCGFIAVDFDLKLQQYLDLAKAQVAKTTFNGEAGFSVNGDPTSWIASNATGNGVDVVSSCRAARVDWEYFKWNSTHAPSYNLTFTNTTASLTLTTKITNSEMSLTFSAPRNTTYKAPIQLAPDSGSEPNFEFVNGDDFVFSQRGQSWSAASSSGAAGTSPTSRRGGSTPTGTGNIGPAATTSKSAAVLGVEGKEIMEVWMVVGIVGGVLAVV